MTRIELLKKLLPGFIPLFVFIAADEIWGTKIGLFVAVGVGMLELVWVWIREKKIDKFILFDTLLLVLLGAISILLENDLFFKLKPGLIELILVTILAVSAFSKVNLVGLMGKRYLKDVQFDEAQVKRMRKSLKSLFYIFSVHTALVFYSAFYMSKEAWAFISGGLFYILFGIYFLFEIFVQKRKQKKYAGEEWVPLVDEKGNVTGQAPRSKVHDGSKLLHPVVHMQVLTPQKAVLLQKRSRSKLIQPGKWDTAVGGHISAGENLEEALKKEAFEEIGLKDFSARLVEVYQWESDIETELVYLFVTYDHKNFQVSTTDEVEEARFWTAKQIEKQLGSELLTPNFEHEFQMLKKKGLL
ncbi:NUDIX domain-containing protein [Mariniphaga sediminis]|uniref:NUDIX domain-containing protein n=1 Tax=Mariniphaga sediminis TaxID=1628158 RepID=UPI00356A39B8